MIRTMTTAAMRSVFKLKNGQKATVRFHVLAEGRWTLITSIRSRGLNLVGHDCHNRIHQFAEGEHHELKVGDEQA